MLFPLTEGVKMKQSFYITEKNWQRIHDYAQEAHDKHKSEIGGMLVAVEDKDGDWVLEDPVILKQEISYSNCILDKEALALYYTKAGVKWKDSNFRFVWWHSHHMMDAFWSGTDLTAIKEYSDGDFSFALVINLKGKHIFRVSSWKPFEMHIDTEVEFFEEDARKTPQKIVNDVEKLCNKRAVTQYYPKKNTYTSYGYNTSGVWGKIENTKTVEKNLNQTSFLEPVVTSDQEQAQAIALVTSLNYRYAAGEITYQQWINSVDQYNMQSNDWYIDDTLKEIDLKKDVVYRKSEDFVEPLFGDVTTHEPTKSAKEYEEYLDKLEEEYYLNRGCGGVY